MDADVSFNNGYYLLNTQLFRERLSDVIRWPLESLNLAICTLRLPTKMLMNEKWRRRDDYSDCGSLRGGGLSCQLH